MKITDLFEKTTKTATLKSVGVVTVFRTEDADPYYKGKTIWGRGRYYSLTRAECERVAKDPRRISEFVVDPGLKVLEFDLTWKDRDRSDFDYKSLHDHLTEAESKRKDVSDLLKKKGVDGIVIRSNSLQYGFSQLVVYAEHDFDEAPKDKK